MASSQRRPPIRDLLERRGVQAILAARLMPGVPTTGLRAAAGVAPVRARAFIVAIAIGVLLRTVPYAVLGQGLGVGIDNDAGARRDLHRRRCPRRRPAGSDAAPAWA